MTISNLANIPSAQRAQVEAVIALERTAAALETDQANDALNGNLVKLELREGDQAIEDVIARTLFRRDRAMSVARHHVRVGLISVGVLAFSATTAYAALSADAHWGWRLAVGCPAGTVALLSMLFLVACVFAFFYETRDDISWKGKAWKRDVAESGYRAGSCWRLGDKGIQTRGSWIYDPEWTLASRFVPYRDINSLLVFEGRNVIGFVDGSEHGKEHVLWDLDDLDIGPVEAAEEIIRLSRAAGHEIESMHIVSKTIKRGPGHVGDDIMERFASAFSDCQATANNSSVFGRISVLMERSDEIPLAHRVASFEGYQVEYLVPKMPVDRPADTDQEVLADSVHGFQSEKEI
jgi:hypothetical protein